MILGFDHRCQLLTMTKNLITRNLNVHDAKQGLWSVRDSFVFKAVTFIEVLL